MSDVEEGVLTVNECSSCGAGCADSPVSDLCRSCLDELAASDPARPLDADARVHLNFGGGKGRWTTIGDLLADEDETPAAAPTQEPESDE